MTGRCGYAPWPCSRAEVTGQDEAVRPATAGRSVSDPQWQAIVAPPFSPHAFIDTDKSTIELELAVIDAPLTSANFIALARKGFFSNIPIHRLVPDFVVQGGDPRAMAEADRATRFATS